jgi:DNA-binding LytR/AlgR family response regulator
MTPLPTFIIDDEPDAGLLLKNLLKEFSIIQVKDLLSDALIALNLIIMEQPPVIFLDIEMPELNGIEFLEQINKFAPKTKVIFVSAHKNYALEALQKSAFDFISKPIDKKELQRVIYKITADLATQNTREISKPSQVLLKTMEGHHYIYPNDVLYFEADGNYTSIVLNDERKLLSSLNLGKIQGMFPAAQFIRISRKHLINKSYLRFMNFCKRYCLVASNGIEHKLEVSAKMKDLKAELG